MKSNPREPVKNAGQDAKIQLLVLTILVSVQLFFSPSLLMDDLCSYIQGIGK